MDSYCVDSIVSFVLARESDLPITKSTAYYITYPLTVHYESVILHTAGHWSNTYILRHLDSTLCFLCDTRMGPISSSLLLGGLSSLV